MRHAVLKVRPSPASPVTPFLIDYRIDGKRRRKYFKTEREADEALRRIKIKLKREGESALSLSDSLRVMAVEGEEALRKHNKTLRDAVTFYVHHLEAAVRSITVQELLDRYMVTQARNSEVHRKDLRNRLGKFAETFGDRLVHTITTEEIRDWVGALGLGPVSHNNWRDRIGFLFGFAVENQYLETNPVNKRFKRQTQTDEAPEIFSVAELQRVLDCATRDHVPSLVLGAFAGIRTAELMRLEWKDVNFVTGFVTVPGRKAKSRSHRSIEMPANLVAWLTPYLGRSGRIWPRTSHSYHHSMRKVWKAAGLVRVPKNGLRHSYASHFIKAFENENLLKLNLGHVGSDLIFSNYRALTTKDEATRYWQIRPAQPTENVLSMTA
jgi:integrase